MSADDHSVVVYNQQKEHVVRQIKLSGVIAAFPVLDEMFLVTKTRGHLTSLTKGTDQELMKNGYVEYSKLHSATAINGGGSVLGHEGGDLTIMSPSGKAIKKIT